MSSSAEPLDFCRVKKIDEKGFGFLKSIHYPLEVFFHFSQIKKEEARESLNKMKRGDFFLFFTSKIVQENKRKADRIWFDLNAVPAELLPNFLSRIISELNDGRTNLFDLIFAVNELKKLNFVNDSSLEEIFRSKKILNLPTTILPYLNDAEFMRFCEALNLEVHQSMPKKPFWFEEVMKRKSEIQN